MTRDGSNEKTDNHLINKLYRERTKNSLRNIYSLNRNLTFPDLKIYYATLNVTLNI